MSTPTVLESVPTYGSGEKEDSDAAGDDVLERGADLLQHEVRMTSAESGLTRAPSESGQMIETPLGVGGSARAPEPTGPATGMMMSAPGR